MRVYLLIPDGVSVRNFIYSGFLAVRPQGVDVTVWTDSPLAELLRVEKCPVPIRELPPFQTTPQIEMLRRAKQTAELLRNARKFGNPVYKRYIMSYKWSQPKQWIKWAWERWLLIGKINDGGVVELKKRYLAKVRETEYYRACLEQLKQGKPDLVFCTHQRASAAIAPMLAAQDLGIPTATFIFSWDNLPKGTLTVPADHYLVWSDYMKREMLQYYPEVPEEHIHVTGTPQFVPYFDKSIWLSREAFCEKHGLNPEHRFICFSGDDLTTSPYDPLYLRDLAHAVERLNAANKVQYRVVFRRCPTDWSDRYDPVLAEYRHIIHVLNPIWKGYEGNQAWNYFVPAREDVALLVNTVLHCDLVVNVGSTMALDFAVLGKPACYIRYDVVPDVRWSARKVYDYIHFQTMNGLDPVYWIDSPADWERVLPQALQDAGGKVRDARRWLAIIAKHPLDQANTRIWQTLTRIAHHAHLLSDQRIPAP